jgi:hypothetical protein
MKLGILFLFSFSLMAATETSCVYDAKASIDEDGDFRVGAFYVGIEGEKKTKRLTDSTSKIGCYKARLKCIPTGETHKHSMNDPFGHSSLNLEFKKHKLVYLDGVAAREEAYISYESCNNAKFFRAMRDWFLN